MIAPYRSREDFERRFAYMLTSPEILSRVLCAEIRYRVIAETVAHVLAVVAVVACGALASAPWWTAAGVACVALRGLLWSRGARRNLRCAELTREAARRKAEDEEAARRWSRELHQGDDEDSDVCG